MTYHPWSLMGAAKSAILKKDFIACTPRYVGRGDKCMVLMFRKTSTEIMKSMAPGWCQNGHIVEMYLIFENLLIYSYMTLRKTKCMVMVSMKPFTKSMKSMAFRCWVQTLRWGQYDHIVKMYLILVTYMYHY